jgi:hypothetical protein
VRFHPAALMLMTWAIAFAIFFILPFMLVGRTMTAYGYLILSVFLATYCGGALLASRPMAQRPRDLSVVIDWRRADQVLIIVCSISMLAFLVDIQGRDILDLAGAYAERSDRATALLQGAESDSSIFFQIGFLTYPASFIYLVREIAFRPRPKLWRVAVFGAAPVILATLTMGGRGPLFFVIAYAVYAYFLRKQLYPTTPPPRRKAAPVRFHPMTGAPIRRRATALRLGNGVKIAGVLLGCVAMFYFTQVFITRAGGSDGIASMLGLVGWNWGVSFNGHFSDLFYSVFGVQGTYLIFVFSWYAIQGVVMSNAIFTGYDGSMLFGTYGVDLVSAVMRRVNGAYVADGFDRLLQMNVYGFVPSAFGSLYIDLKFFGLIPCFAWGWLSGLVYRKIKEGVDPRYLLFVPFLSIGIVMSLNNTPIGLSNGLMLHFWLLTFFFLARTRRAGQVAARSPSPAYGPSR